VCVAFVVSTLNIRPLLLIYAHLRTIYLVTKMTMVDLGAVFGEVISAYAEQ
jgi:hypothetical protein